MFREIFTDHALIDFNDLMNRLAVYNRTEYSVIGFNFKEGKVSSIKIYYVFLENINFWNGFPIPELEKVYYEYVTGKSNYHVNTPRSNGGGITFAIKFDLSLNCTKGFYFRMDRDNAELTKNICEIYPEFSLVPSDFEDGYGQYIILKNGQIETNEYLYINNPMKTVSMDGVYDIHFSQSNCVEVSSCKEGRTASRKFITNKWGDFITEKFKSKIPDAILNLLAGTDTTWCCPGVSPSKNEYSFYTYKKHERQDTGFSTLVDKLIEKFNDKSQSVKVY